MKEALAIAHGWTGYIILIYLLVLNLTQVFVFAEDWASYPCI